MLSGLPTVFGIKVYEESSDQKHPLGTKGITLDGRIFRYGQANGSCAVGKICTVADLVANHEDRACNTFAIGDTSVTVTLGATAVTENYYAEGYLVVNDDTGEGTAYPIESNPASSGSEDITVYLKQPIHTAAGADTTVTLVANPWRDVATSAGDSKVDIGAGVPLITVTDNYYAWFQTGGMCPVLSNATVPVAGQPVCVADTTAGSVEPRAAATDGTVGRAVTGLTYTSGEYNPIFLTMDN